MSDPLDSLEDAKITCERFYELLELQPSPATTPATTGAAPQLAQSPSPAQISAQLLVLDLRSFLVYNQAHSKGAVNICIPKTLVKRCGFTIKSLESGICKKGDKDEFRQRKGATVVLYDQNGTERDHTSLLAKCYEVLVKEMLCQHVYWLEGKQTNHFVGFPPFSLQSDSLLLPLPLSTLCHFGRWFLKAPKSSPGCCPHHQGHGDSKALWCRPRPEDTARPSYCPRGNDWEQ